MLDISTKANFHFGVFRRTTARTTFLSFLPGLAFLLATAIGHGQSNQVEILVVGVEGAGEVVATGLNQTSSLAVGTTLTPQVTIRTKANSRVTLLLGGATVIRGGADTEFELLPGANGRVVTRLTRGALYFLHRDKAGRFSVETPAATANVVGTDFGIVVALNATTTIDLFDGEVEFANAQGNVPLKGRSAAIAEVGKPPQRTAVIEMRRAVQWNLYYPAVVDVDELSLDSSTADAIRDSVSAYRSGDLLAALATYPAGRQPATRAEELYFAGLLLSVGSVTNAQQFLNTSASPATPADNDRLDSIERGLHRVIATVLGERPATQFATPTNTATEWLAMSYERQGLTNLTSALEAAQMAVKADTNFSFAHARVAELEFSFGRIPAAKRSLDTALSLSPKNAQAVALNGFLLAARNKFRDAQMAFEQSTRLDPSLANGWLGRGLCRIHSGDVRGGLEDLQIAAATEPTRAVLRSYLAKALQLDRQRAKARSELDLAKRLDPNDPTPWLYAALMDREEYRYNQAVEDQERSLALNENRTVYRSQLLLDKDRAVRSSGLAANYENVGMGEVSLAEAARAVSYDYANYSAHLFLSESYNTLRDPTRFNLRNETVWFNELLLANLLSPVGGTPLSQNISQQEYTRLFDQNRLGLTSSSEYRSDGQYREVASQYGNYNNFAYSLDVDYQHNDGTRPNNELDRLEWYSTIKYQLTPQDSFLLMTKYQDYHSGDNYQRYDQSVIKTNYTQRFAVSTNFSFDENQQPLLVAGYHREWSPGVHTLVMGSRLENDQRFTDRDIGVFVLQPDPSGTVGADDVSLVPFDIDYHSKFEIYTLELNQILQSERNLLVFGAYFQHGNFRTSDQLTLGGNAQGLQGFEDPPAAADIESDFERVSGYGYYTLKLPANLNLTAGLSYDCISYPSNHRSPPISEGESDSDRLNPKAAIVWSPSPELTLRGAYTRSLGGISFDESFRLEPAQLAGFKQSYRSLASESVVGSVSAPTYETTGVAVDLKLKTRTYLGLQTELLRTKIDRDIGVFEELGGTGPPPIKIPSSTPQDLDYNEWSATAFINQLLMDTWSLGGQYRYSHSRLHTKFPDVPSLNNSEDADLQQATVFALFNHPSGFFARADIQWFHQDNSAYPTSDFYQCNIFAGWRFPRQHGELSVGVMNLTDTDYQLNPLNAYTELPRERAFVARLTFNF